MVIQQLKFLILLKMKTKLISIIFLIKYSTDLFIKLFNKKNIFIFPFYHTGIFGTRRVGFVTKKKIASVF